MKCEGQKLLLGTALSVVHLLRQAVGTPRLRPRVTALPMEALLGLVLVMVLALVLALVMVLVMVLVALALAMVLVLVMVMAMLLVMASVAMVAPVVGLGLALRLRLGMGQLQRMSRVRRSPPTLLKRTAAPHLTAEATPLTMSVGHSVKLAPMPVTSRLHESLSWSRR